MGSNKYGDIQSFFISQKEIWKPDVTFRNRKREITELGSEIVRVRVFSSVEIVWITYEIIEASCDIDITHFPFDQQKCTIQFVNWIGDNLALHFTSIDTLGHFN